MDPPPPQLVSILRQGPYLIASIHTALDDGQLLRFQHELVDRIGRDRAYGIVIDVAALDVLDSFGARTLRNLAESAKLRGARTVVVGINPEVAFAMVQLGMGLDSVDTALDLEEGIAVLDAWLRGRRDVADGPVRGARRGRFVRAAGDPSAMSDRLDRLARDYAPALLAFLGQPGEPRLRSAYELGRLALADGVSLLDVVRVHHAVLSDVLTSSTRDEDVASVVAGAATFLVEVLASFEMAQGAFQEAVANERRAGTLDEDG